MYKRGQSVPLKSSASLLSNNLDICKIPGKALDECKLAVIHKSVVWVFTPKEVNSKDHADGVLPYKQVYCKGESSQFCSTILQVTNLWIQNVLCFSFQGNTQEYFYSFKN